VAFRRRPRWLLRIRQLGFTLIEMLVVISVVGVLAAIATPSFLSTMEAAKVDQTIAEIRGALQETQRQAIRKSQICSVSVDVASVTPSESPRNQTGNYQGGNQGGSLGGSPGINALSGNCLTSGDRELPEGVDMATNISGNSTADIAVQFGTLGSADFGIISEGSATIQDPSGKIIAFVPTRNNIQKKCIAISNTLGLTRVGNYIGDITPASITGSGICTVLEWDKQ
jgi:prepilin-type N-terminal cleavage/methylation domain-containing protein